MSPNDTDEWHTVFSEQECQGAASQVAHKPQARQTPFSFEEVLSDKAAHRYQVATVDSAGWKAKTEGLLLSAV